MQSKQSRWENEAERTRKEADKALAIMFEVFTMQAIE